MGGTNVAENKYSALIQTVPLFIAAAGIVVGVWQYRDVNAQQYKKEIWSAQKALFEKAITAAATIANGDSLESVTNERKDFWALYWGNLAMLESRSVERAMIEYANILRPCEINAQAECLKPGPKGNPLQRAALNLAHCARDTLRTTWEPVDIGKLTEECLYK
jgi:hypothetical protein